MAVHIDVRAVADSLDKLAACGSPVDARVCGFNRMRSAVVSRSSYFRVGVCYERGAIEENIADPICLCASEASRL